MSYNADESLAWTLGVIMPRSQLFRDIILN
jgi:hypothetical protein